MIDKEKIKNIKGLLLLFILLYLFITITPIAVYKSTASKSNAASNTLSDEVKASKMLPENSETSNPGSDMVNEDNQDNSSSSSATEDEEPKGFLDNYSPPGNPEPPSTAASEKADNFRILDTATGKVLTVSAREFLPAAVVCEMPLSAPEEALKAQAIAAYTYYVRERDYGGLENADFTCNTDNWLIYVTEEDMKERWGEDFDAYYSKIKSITDSVYGEMLTYEGEPICAAYFSISNGSTEACANVWGGDLPYLAPVASPGDALSSGYMSEVVMSGEQVRTSLENSLDYDFDFELPMDKWFTNQIFSNAGYTSTIDVCGTTLKGTEVRSAMSLPGTTFDISLEDGYFTFTVKGYGHGVGMSQAGAMFMAEQGSTYEEILLHYYTGVTLENEA